MTLSDSNRLTKVALIKRFNSIIDARSLDPSLKLRLADPIRNVHLRMLIEHVRTVTRTVVLTTDGREVPTADVRRGK